MSRTQNMTGWHTVSRVVIWQSVLTGLASSLFFFAKSPIYGYGALAGGGICIGTGVLFAVNLFARGAKDSPQQILAAFYTAEGLKFILTVALFALAAVYFREGFMAVIITYSITVLMYWIALLFK